MGRNLIWVQQIFNDFIAGKLNDVDRDMNLSENAQRGLADHRGEENVGVSDNAFDKHQSPL